jgi:murein DD-endopeptidase MepM/ murein hydrolase activator NlpD
MIKIKLLIIVVFFSSFIDDPLLKTISSYLTKATKYQEIEKLYSILGREKIKYKLQLSYIPSISPLNPDKTKRYSDMFGNRFHPLDGEIKKHVGVDIAASYGTPVHASASGVVKSISLSLTGYGKQIEITHDFGFQTKYAHLYTIIVSKGDKINKGDIIGFVGSTGKSTGSHLHYEIKKNNINIDPYPFCFLNNFESK